MPKIIDFLFPKEKKFLNMLRDQSEVLLKGAEEFREFVSDFNKLKKGEKKEKVEKIREVEHKGDEAMGKIIDSLQETFITPLDREDIYSLTRSMDDILDFFNETAAMVMMYDVKKMPDNVKEFVKILSTCCEIIKASMYHLKDYKKTKKAVRELHNLEVEADNLYYKTMAEIFQENSDVKELIKLKDIYTLLEEAADKCNRIGNILGNIVVKHG